MLSNRIEILLININVMFILYFFRFLMKKTQTEQKLSFKMLNALILFHWIVTGFLLQYLSNLLSITLYRAELPPLPFKTFFEMKTAAEQKKITILMNTYEVVEVDEQYVKRVHNLEEALELILQNPSFTVFELIFKPLKLFR